MAIKYNPAPLHTVIFLAVAHAALGRNDQAIEWIRRYSPREDVHFQLHLRCEASFAPLTKDPRYQALLIKRAADRSRDCGIL